MPPGTQLLTTTTTPCHPGDTEAVPPTQSALLEEQKSVMDKCAEERRRLAAEWADFFTQQKLSKEREAREVERALQADSQREGALVTLAKVGLTPAAGRRLPGLGERVLVTAGHGNHSHCISP